MTAAEFSDLLSKGACPFCKSVLKFYDGALGYEAVRCVPCGLSVDHGGIHIEEQGNGKSKTE